jgi:pyridoxine kinase
MEAAGVAKSPGKREQPMQIISLQSRVAYGHVGNSAAVPVLQRLGHDTAAVDTTLLSNHLGYETHGGRILPAVDVAAVVEGLMKLGILARCDALLTGFLGHSASVAGDTVQWLRMENPNALYCLDPVMGERDGGLYVAEATATTISQRLVPEADILMPNAFELDYLCGARNRSLSDVATASDALLRRARPGGVIIATGLDRDEGPRERVEVMASTKGARYLASVPRLDLPAHGAGDLFAALFLGHYLHGRNLPNALARTMDATHLVFGNSLGKPDLALVQSLEALRDPPRAATIEQIG